MSRLNFQIEARAEGSKARAARFRTLHNEVETPIFMPVGTRATVRAQTFDTLEKLNPPIILANTYHLLLRPGAEDFRKIGGIHKLTGWNNSVLTDSGGFQIFSLPNQREVSEKGATFTSLLNQQRYKLSPEISIDMQKAIGSDIMMVLDICEPSTVEHKIAEEAMERTHRWALRSQEARGDSPAALFAITQGACYQDLRKQSAEFLSEHNFDGFAIGGLAVGETKTEREDTTEFTIQYLREDRPRYLMGVGTPIDLLEAVHRGVDMFDCVLPTSLAQQGIAYTRNGKVSLKRGSFKFDTESPIDEECDCSTCKRHSRAYLHHLTRSKEVLGWTLIGVHNLHFYLDFMKQIRCSILENRFLEFYKLHRELVGRNYLI